MLNFTFTFPVNIYTMIVGVGGGGVGNLPWSRRPSPISRSVTQFKVAFADACLNNLQSTVGSLSLHPLPRPLPPFAPLPTAVDTVTNRSE